MKHFLLCLASIGLFFTGNAQTNLLSEDFSSANVGTPPTGWTMNQLYTTVPATDSWRFDNPANRTIGGTFSGQFAIFDSDNYSNDATFELIAIESPEISTQGYDTTYLVYDYWFNFAGTANGAIEVFDGDRWNAVKNITTTTTAVTRDSLDVSEWVRNNCNVKFRFLWSCNSGGWWAVDNVGFYGIGLRKTTNISPVELVGPTNGLCGTDKAGLTIRLDNDGTNGVSNVPIKVIVTDQTTPVTILDTLKSTIATCNTFDYTLANTVDLSKDDVVYTFTIITNLDGDQTTVFSDTLIVDNFLIVRPPRPPAADTLYGCGTQHAYGIVNLDADNEAFWYDQPSGGSPLVNNDSFYFGYQIPVFDSTVYVETFRSQKNVFPLNNTLPNVGFNNISSGVYLDIIAKNDIILDSLEVDTRVGTAFPYEVYLVEGSYQPVFNNSTAWKKVYTGNISISGATTKIPVGSISIDANDTVGIYIFNTGTNTVEFAAGPVINDNKDIKTYSNHVNATTAFAGTQLTSFGYSGKYYYRRPCFSNRVPIRAVNNKKPIGAENIVSTPFEGRKGNGINVPDAIGADSAATYEILPPTGYQNSGFGTTWIITDLIAMSAGGSPIPTGDTTILAYPGVGNGKLQYVPSKGWEDSLVIFYSVIRELNTPWMCDTMIKREVFVAPAPQLDFSFNKPCNGGNVTFTNNTSLSSGTLKHFWDFGDGTTSTQEQPVKKYANSGTYTVFYKASSDFNIHRDTSFTVEVSPNPQIGYSFTNQCEGVAIDFNNSSSVASGTLNYFWDFGDGKNSTAQSPSHLYSTPGTYTVELTVESDKGCIVDTVFNASQFHRPNANFDHYGSCANREISFISNSNIGSGAPLTASWDFGNGKNGNGNTIKHTYDANGKVNVKMVVTSGFGCQDSITKVVDVQQGPKPDFELSQLCSKVAVDFINLTDDGGTATNYEWEFGEGGNTSTDETPTYTYNTSGFYDIRLNAYGTNGCNSSKLKRIEIKNGVVADFDFEGLCEEEQFKFTNQSDVDDGVVKSNWSFGDGTTSITGSPFKSYDVQVSSTFDVTLIETVDGNCADTITKQVKVGATPICTFTAEQGEDRRSFTFIPTDQSHSNYTWTINGETKTEVTPTYDFPDYNKNYQIKLAVETVDGCECSDGKLDVKTAWSNGVNQPELADIGVKLYPVPATNFVTVEWANSKVNKVTQIKVINAQGAEVKVIEQGLNSGMYQLGTETLASGVYWIQIEADNNSYQQQFVINK